MAPVSAVQEILLRASVWLIPKRPLWRVRIMVLATMERPHELPAFARALHSVLGRYYNVSTTPYGIRRGAYVQLHRDILESQDEVAKAVMERVDKLLKCRWSRFSIMEAAEALMEFWEQLQLEHVFARLLAEDDYAGVVARLSAISPVFKQLLGRLVYYDCDLKCMRKEVSHLILSAKNDWMRDLAMLLPGGLHGTRKECAESKLAELRAKSDKEELVGILEYQLMQYCLAYEDDSNSD